MKTLFLHGCLWLVACLWVTACSHYSPKPAGYFRIDLPEPAYRMQEFPGFTCRISEQAQVETALDSVQNEFFNLVYRQWNARIYCSYLPVKKDNLAQFSEESRKFVYLHAIKADAIREQRFDNPKHKVYGLLYAIGGNVASPVQFVLTDSVRSFFRGALYFDNTPNQDSIAPVLEYIHNDILILMESFRWKQ
ncbi:MAG: gliding motility protein GldD [Dysgonamonadaceae bacterium]|jgi:gliding motility-associated lipoprotein GldD|nr:gliding motility protein GldD [Dysgonamonadaceae bacterium]